MARAIAFYSGGIHYLIEVAVREDGRLFRRLQDKDPRFGYRWTAWKPTGATWGDNMRKNPPPTIPAGFSTLSLAHPASYHDSHRYRDGRLKYRLPD